MRIEDYRALAKRAFGGRPWIVSNDVLASLTPTVAELRELGATKCLCVAGIEGVGPTPDREFAPSPIVLGLEAPDVMSGIRASLDALANLPESVVRQIEAFDPDRRARVIGPPIFDDGRELAGRKKYGARAKEWQALEDKTIVDELWDAAGIRRAPSEIVDARRDALLAAHQRLDTGSGTVWVGDNREGFHGGAAYLRWVRSADDGDGAAEFLSAHCDRARVMPFLDGVPCSIHGIVFDEATIAFRPCEMFVLRRPGESTLHYARAGTLWDPRPDDREAMREAARRVGDHLRATVGYRGSFTIDGVMTKDGFLPTELNPRYGAALGVLMRGLPDLPLLLLNLAIVEGEPFDWQPRELERLVVEAADVKRSAGGMSLSKTRVSEAAEAKLVRDESGAFRVAPDDATADATAQVGPAAMGAFVSVTLDAERATVGPSSAPDIAAALRCVDEHWGLELGPLEPAPDLRR